jgi:tripartite-type tricarboxylate transporter receptor subunit TctC
MRAILAALLAAALLPATAFADAYPARPVTFVVPFPPGGGTDIAARVVAQKLTAMWGQSVVVENRAGAAGIVGTDVVAKAKPDGYTLLIANVGIPSINPVLYAKLPYNPDTAFAPISQICDLPFVLMATPSFPANTPKELVALAKAKPDTVTFASSGSGGSPHLTAEIFQQATGTRMMHVPYKGGGPAMTDLMAGHVNLLFASILEGSGHIKSGKLKALAVTSPKRSPALPDVPTLAEAGVKDCEISEWNALLAPAGTPPAVLERLHAEVAKIMRMDDIKAKFADLGAEAIGSTPAEFATFLRAEMAKWAEVVKAANIKIE